MIEDARPDPLERELQRHFDAIGAPTEDPDAVLDSMRPRLRRAQRNHRLLNGAVAAVVVAGALVVALLVFGSGSDPGRHVRVPPANPSPRVTTTTPGVSGPEPVPAPTIPTGGEQSGQVGTTGDQDGAEPATPQAGTAPGPAARTPNVAPSPSPAAQPAPAPTTVPPVSDTPFSSPDGSIVVHRSGNTISLASSGPSGGFTQEIHDNGPTRVEVRFNDGNAEWRIRVDLINGQLQAETTQH
jgi:hypothetical protein